MQKSSNFFSKNGQISTKKLSNCKIIHCAAAQHCKELRKKNSGHFLLVLISIKLFFLALLQKLHLRNNMKPFNETLGALL